MVTAPVAKSAVTVPVLVPAPLMLEVMFVIDIPEEVFFPVGGLVRESYNLLLGSVASLKNVLVAEEKRSLASHSLDEDKSRDC